ncbi:MAG: CDP-alcohol phosphatidyltransferase family protein [Gammaproteobacteria bacterium]
MNGVAAYAFIQDAVAGTRAAILQLAEALARLLARFGVTPDQVTIAGCCVSLAAALALLAGHPVTAGLLYWAGGSLDMVDGALARHSGRDNAFGAFFDSLLDRVGEAGMLAALAYRFAAQDQPLAVVAVMLALFGGMLTSYIRARAEGLGIACHEGLVQRPGRVLSIVFGLLSGLLAPLVYGLAAATLWTAWQRAEQVGLALRGRAASGA